MMQYAILRHLQSNNLTVNELARRMMIKPPSLIASVDALEQKGYLQRKSDPDDRRRSPLHITSKGKALLRKVPFCAEMDALSVALEHLGIRKTEQLARLLEELTAEVAKVKGE